MIRKTERLLRSFILLVDEYEQWNSWERSDGLIVHTDAIGDFLKWLQRKVDEEARMLALQKEAAPPVEYCPRCAGEPICTQVALVRDWMGKTGIRCPNCLWPFGG